MLRIQLIILFLFMVSTSFSQNRLGLSTGDFAGVNGVVINPSSSVNSKYYIDIQLAGAGVSTKNNYIFYKKDLRTLNDIISKSPTFSYFIDSLANTRERYFGENFNKKLKGGYFNARVFGPSFMMNKGNYSYGFFSGVRSSIMMKNSSYDVTKFLYELFDYPELHNINFKNEIDMHYEVLNFAELGLNYSQNIYAGNFERVDVGINLKYLKPHSGTKIYVDKLDYVVPDDSTLVVFKGDGDLRFSAPVNYDNNNYKHAPFFKGYGLGADLGITYTKSEYFQRNTLPEKRYRLDKKDNYKYRIGFSVLDLGYVSFNKRAQSHEYRNFSTFWRGIDEIEYENINASIDTINAHFNPPSKSGNSFTMLLPTALSLQFDYHYFNNWYLNSVLMYNINKKANGYNRPHYLSFMPRYENAHMGIGIPFSLYDFKQPQVGFNFRFYFLNIGTSNLSYYLGMSDISDMDIYFSIKFNILRIDNFFRDIENFMGRKITNKPDYKY